MRHTAPLTALVLLLSLSLSAQSLPFHEGNWASALHRAAEEQKLIFLDAYTTWCGPCRLMDRQTFVDPKVIAFYSQHFINVKMDMEKGEGIGLARQYAVQAYPSLLFINAAGQVVHRVAGFHNPEQFLELGETALDPADALLHFDQRFARGDRDPAFLHTYAYRRAQAMDGSHGPAVAAYLETQSDWSTTQNLEFIYSFAEYIDDRPFRYLVDQRPAFEAHFGSVAVLRKIEQVVDRAAFLAEPEWPAVRQLLQQVYPGDAERQFLLMQMNHALQSGAMADYTRITLTYFKRYPDADAGALNDAAWAFYERVDDPKALKEALKWARKAVSLEDEYDYNDTLAALYAKLGNKKKARQVGEHAIRLAKEQGLDYELTRKLLENL